MVYEDIFDAKNACDHLSGFNVCNRYLVVLYYNANRVSISMVLIMWGEPMRELVENCTIRGDVYLSSFLAGTIGEIHLTVDW